MLTVCAPVVAAKSPDCDTVTLTDRAALGAGLAVRVKVASLPSVTPLPAAMLISGVDDGGAGSSSVMVTVEVAVTPEGLAVAATVTVSVTVVDAVIRWRQREGAAAGIRAGGNGETE